MRLSKPILFTMCSRFLFLGFTFSIISTLSGYGQQRKKPVFTYIEKMPQFKGNMDSFIRSHLRYPEVMRDIDIGGRVVVKVLIDEGGRVTNPVIERSLYPALDTEALRIIRLMPDWKPAKQHGKPIQFFYHIPVIFKLD